MPEQDALDRLLALGPNERQEIVSHLSPEQVKVISSKIEQRKQKKSQLLESRKAASTAEFEKNKLESTIGTRSRESAIGLLEPFTASSIGSTVEQLGNIGYDALTGNASKTITELRDLAKGFLSAPVKPLINLEEGIRTGDYDRAAYGAGGFASQTAPAIEGLSKVPKAISTAKGAIAASDLPRRLLQQAEDIRSRPGVKLPGTGIGLKSSAIHRVAQEVAKRRPVARAYEIAGEKLAGKNRLPLTRGEIAADEASRIRQAQNVEVAEQPKETYTPPTPVPPEAPTFILEDLRRQAAEQRNPQSNWQSIEESIAPSGNKAKRATQTFDEFGKPTAFGRKLVEQVPEITKATKATAPGILMEGMRRVLQNLQETEDAIPEGTQVDTIPITSKLFEMSQEYAESGLQKVADQIDKIRTQWQSKNVPWGEFLAKKRAFFKDHNLRSAPMRRVYGVLMEAADRISPSLAEANLNYSTVRRALDNANVDINTGRRVSEVGKAPGKSSFVPTERAKPVANRQEGLDLFQK